jgi:hypothetical protein
MIVNIKEIIDKLASRKPGVTAVAGATAATGAVEVTWPGYSDGVYRGADGGGYVGRVRRGRGVRHR